jgi:rod shape-determining protein MreD
VYFLIRLGLYILLLFLAFIIPPALNLSVQPVIIIPIAMCISMNENGELRAALTGSLCGLLVDGAYGKLFGYNAIMLLIICLFTRLLFTHWLRVSLLNISVLCIVFTFLWTVFDYVFYYAIWNYDSNGMIFLHYHLRIWLLTSLCILVVYPIMRFIRTKFDLNLSYRIE